MGPSGAGKSSLLDALADRIKAPVDGVQWLNGKRKTEGRLREISKYVQQEDSLLGALTVREVFRTATELYNPNRAQHEAVVESVATMMGLERQLDTKIGDQFFRGLSGGQKRRVSIGIELIAQPEMLFLDEPTSGLDSASSYSIMSSLQSWAQATQTPMIITIHQPSQLLFELGDTLLLLSGGHTAFFGPIDNVSEHFKLLGFTRPEGTSTAEWLLNLINREFGSDVIVDACLSGWPTSPACALLTARLEEAGVPRDGMDASTLHMSRHELAMEELADSVTHYRTSQLQATWALMKRSFIVSVRSPAAFWMRFVMYILLTILIGTVWLQLGTSASVISDTSGALFCVSAFMCLLSVAVIPLFLEERAMFSRERANGSYSTLSYAIAQFVVEIPFLFLIALVCSSIVYWLVGFTPGANRFFIFVANLFMALLVSEALMTAIAAVINSFVLGIAAASLILATFMITMGYFIRLESIGWWWRWIQFISYNYYNFSAFMSNQFTGTVYAASCPDGLGSFDCFPEPVIGEGYLSIFSFELRIWVNMLVQIAMVLVYRTFAALWMNFFVRGKK